MRAIDIIWIAYVDLVIPWLILQYLVHFYGTPFGALSFRIYALSGLGNMVGASVASFISSEIISIGGVLLATEMGFIIAVALFAVMMFIQPGASSINGDDDGTSHPPHAPSAIGAPGVDFHGLQSRV